MSFCSCEPHLDDVDQRCPVHFPRAYAEYQAQRLTAAQVELKRSQALRLERAGSAPVLAPNSIRWVALDLALMAEGLIVVPLYARQAPGELATEPRDSGDRN